MLALLLFDERASRREIHLGDRHRQVIVSDRVSYIAVDFVKPGKGGRMSKIKTMYVGFATLREAHRYARASRKRCQVREAGVNELRSLDWDYEVKVQGDIELAEVEAIAANLDKFFPVVDRNEEDDNRGSGRDFRRPTLQQRRSWALFC